MILVAVLQVRGKGYGVQGHSGDPCGPVGENNIKQHRNLYIQNKS